MKTVNFHALYKICLVIAIFIVGAFSAGETGAQNKKTKLHPYSSEKSLTEAVLFAPGVVSTDEHEDSPGFSRDGRTIYWETGTPVLATIVYSEFKNGAWTKPRVAPFSGQYQDRDPFETPDGKRLYFCSLRPRPGTTQPRGDWDIWFVEKTASGSWGEPQRVAEPINSDRNELYATLTTAGTLYFGTDRAGQWDLYRAKSAGNKFGEIENLGENVNSAAWDFNPAISPDERFILFSSQRQNAAAGSINIFVSYNRDGKWTKAVPLNEKVNKPGFQYHPTISPDGKYLFFCGGGRGLDGETLAKPFNYENLMKGFRSHLNRSGNIYQIELQAAGIEK